MVTSGTIKLIGEAQTLITFRSLLDQFERRFPIVTPMPAIAHNAD
jgi:alkyl sulfatase BDS1-like metallo-beta-lactamase superfamily hydrolase